MDRAEGAISAQQPRYIGSVSSWDRLGEVLASLWLLCVSSSMEEHTFPGSDRIVAWGGIMNGFVKRRRAGFTLLIHVLWST